MEPPDSFTFVAAPEDFPDPSTGPGDFPVAVGWTLAPELMLAGYARGIFAWTDDPVTWWSPDPRAIIELDGFHCSRSLARTLKRGRYDVSIDRDFLGVVDGCAGPRAHETGTWISDDFRASFYRLHRAGRAHSVEAWLDGVLVGGVFGVSVGGLFSAESMFHRATDASKVAVYHLVRALRGAGYSLVDIQVISPHTESLGAVDITRTAYLERLDGALRLRPGPLRLMD